MIKYEIVIDKPARKFIEKQPKEQQKRLILAIYKLPYEGDIKKMVGFENVYRLRVGSYRVIYELYEQTLIVKVTNAGNRGDIYK